MKLLPTRPSPPAPPPDPPPAPKPRAEPAPAARPPAAPRVATRAQRIALFAGVAGTLLLGLWLFSPILTPFVLAAVIAYFLDPVAGRLNRIGVPRGLAALLLVLGMVAMALLALLLLSPLLISQVTVLLQRLPSYVLGVGQAMRDALVALSERVPDVFDQRLQDLAVGQAGAIISWIGTSLARLIGGSQATIRSSIRGQSRSR